jgi:hypothetical protein
MAKAKYKYVMDYIKDPDVYKAVSFARAMIRKGETPAIANRIAAHYYGVDVHDVAHYVAQVAGRIGAEKRGEEV